MNDAHPVMSYLRAQQEGQEAESSNKPSSALRGVEEKGLDVEEETAEEEEEDMAEKKRHPLPYPK